MLFVVCVFFLHVRAAIIIILLTPTKNVNLHFFCCPLSSVCFVNSCCVIRYLIYMRGLECERGRRRCLGIIKKKKSVGSGSGQGDPDIAATRDGTLRLSVLGDLRFEAASPGVGRSAGRRATPTSGFGAAGVQRDRSAALSVRHAPELDRRGRHHQQTVIISRLPRHSA